MTRVLLLDDSLTILKVVRLTFASTPGFEVDVAKTEADARASLARAAPDVVVGYARFCQDRTPAFFEEVRARCANIVVLTESNENTQAFVAKGFLRFLKKPFHSEELRKAVGEDTLGGASNKTKISPAPESLAFSTREFPVASDEPTLSAKAAPRTPTDFVRDTPFTPPPPPPSTLTHARPPRPPPPPPPSAPRVFDGGAAAALGFAPEPDALSLVARAAPSEVEIPQITMDVESLERSYRATMSSKNGAKPDDATVVAATAPSASKVAAMPRTPSFEANESALTFLELEETPSSKNPFSGMFDGASRRSGGPGSPGSIELGPPPTEPLVLENVVVSTPSSAGTRARGRGEDIEFTNPFEGATGGAVPSDKARSAFSSLGIGGGTSPASPQSPSSHSHTPPTGISRAEIEATIDDVLMRALERAVPAKIDSKFDQEWNRMAMDVALRIKADVAASVRADLAGALRGLIESEVRREMQGWMAREATSLAKDVVREEIRRLIEE